MKFFNFLKKKNTIIWIINFIVSVVLIIVGYKITQSKYIALNGENSSKEAVVTEIINKEESSYEVDGIKHTTAEISFKAKLKDGQVVEAIQTIDEYSSTYKMVEKGDKIMIYKSDDIYYFGDYMYFWPNAPFTSLAFSMILMNYRPWIFRRTN